jgi:hypothetical protein
MTRNRRGGLRRIALALLALPLASAAQAASRGGGIGHGPPDTFPHAPLVCAIPYGVKCPAKVFSRPGEPCACDSPHGKLRGEVTWKYQ